MNSVKNDIILPKRYHFFQTTQLIQLINTHVPVLLTGNSQVIELRT